MKLIIPLGQQTDWYYTNDYRLRAQNRDTRMFEHTSYTDGMVMELYTDTDENDVANALGNRLREGEEYEFALYNERNELVGFAYYKDGKDKKAETKKRVFRFHAHTWVDIVVDVTDDMDDADCFSLAYDKYNNGEYEEDPSNFENTEVTEVTDYLKEEGIYPFNK